MFSSLLYCVLGHFQLFNVLFSSNFVSYMLDWFHNLNCSLLLGVVFYVCLSIMFLWVSSSFVNRGLESFQISEFVCSLLPVFLLLFQMFPSLVLLYYYGLVAIGSEISLNVVGHQWYWGYDYSDFGSLDFDSYMSSGDSLVSGGSRLIEVDSRCVVPISLALRFCVTSADVIHSWTLFNLFLNLDAISGVLSVFFFNFSVLGVYYGQCSEICGSNHSFMPVVLEAVPFDLFKFWCVSF